MAAAYLCRFGYPPFTEKFNKKGKVGSVTVDRIRSQTTLDSEILKKVVKLFA